MQTNQEIFKDVPGYEGLYLVSNTGKVKSLISGGKILKTHTDKRGYKGLSLKCKSFRVHVLVAMAFLGHTPDGYKLVVDHIDNDPGNNNSNNLQLITNRENSSKDKWRFNHSSKYPCVSWNKQLKKWGARVRINGTRKFLGYFFDEIDAHNAVQKLLAES